jgi:hypothetical protein
MFLVDSSNASLSELDSNQSPSNQSHSILQHIQTTFPSDILAMNEKIDMGVILSSPLSKITPTKQPTFHSPISSKSRQVIDYIEVKAGGYNVKSYKNV